MIVNDNFIIFAKEEEYIMTGDDMRFTKMQAYGNDYAYIFAFSGVPAQLTRLARFCSDRRRGIGGDGMILICRSDTCDIKMRVFNPDGSEAEMCGNALRSAAALAYMKGIAAGKRVTVETLAGVRSVDILECDGAVCRAAAYLGKAQNVKIYGFPLKVRSKRFEAAYVSLGNPHCVVFAENINKLDLKKYGGDIEKSRLFPNGANVHFCSPGGGNIINARSWERRCGETPSCATGAAAILYACAVTGRSGKCAYIKHPGGMLLVESREDGLRVTGETRVVYEGEFSPENVL